MAVLGLSRTASFDSGRSRTSTESQTVLDHPLHSNNHSIRSIDDQTLTLHNIPHIDTTEDSPPSLMSTIDSNESIHSVKSTQSISTSSKPRIRNKESINPISFTCPCPSGPQSPVSSVNKLSIRSNSSSNHISVFGTSSGYSNNNNANSTNIISASDNLRNMLAQSTTGTDGHFHERPIKPADYGYEDEDLDDGRHSLFDEVTYSSAPGNLHLLSDNAIERFVNRYGIVNVVRQLATDLAERETEVILVRKQQEDRERELKRLLSQCGVSMAEVEKVLHNMKRPKQPLDEMIQQAIDQNVIPFESKSTSSETVKNHSSSAQQSQPLASKPIRDKSSTISMISEDDNQSLYSTENSTQHPQDDKRSIISGNSMFKPRPRSSSQAFEWIPKTIKDHVPGQSVLHPPVTDTKRPLELDDIVPQNIQPPTLLHSWNAHYGQQNSYLTDRYGFIYNKHIKPGKADEDGDETVREDPSTLSKTAQKRERPHVVITNNIRVLGQNTDQPEVTTQTAIAASSSSSTNPDTESGSVRMLLAQLTDMHDSIQKAQTNRWDEFLKKLNQIADSKPNELIRTGTDLIGVSGSGLTNEHNTTSTSGFSFFFNGNGNGNSLLGTFGRRKKGSQKLGKEFKSLVLGGVPVAYRAKIWGECSGARSLFTPGVYQSLIERDDDPSEAVNQIDLDLYRTMPYNVFFGSSGPGVQKLRRVLVAFSRRNPEVGYCQGMNLIAAMLLLVFATEEDAFWLLVSLVENILPAGYFSPPLLTSRADQTVFNGLFIELLPELSDHLSSIHVQVEAITFDWFLSCFTDSLPPDVLFRVWDVFLCVDGEVYLFRLALALFKMYESELLKLASASEVYSFMKQLNYQPVRVEMLVKEAEALSQVVDDADVKIKRQSEIEKMLEEMGVA